MSAVEHCSITDLFEVHETLPPDLEVTLVDYLKPFAKPTSDGKCFKCERTLGGLIGSFTWGIVHGEGFCSGCKWPGRAKHYIKDSDGDKDLVRFTYILQYHPEVVTKRKRTA